MPVACNRREMDTGKKGSVDFTPLEGKEKRTSSSYLSPGGSTGTMKLGCV